MTDLVKKNEFLREVPLVAIRGSVVFPRTDNILTFGRPKSILAVNSAFHGERVVAIFTQKDPNILEPGQNDLYKIGTVATITQMMSSEEEFMLWFTVRLGLS